MKLWPVTVHATIEFDSSGAHQDADTWWRPYFRRWFSRCDRLGDLGVGFCIGALGVYVMASLILYGDPE